jgi:hypothetical protein
MLKAIEQRGAGDTPRNAVSAAYNHALHLKARTKMTREWANYLDAMQQSTKFPGFRCGHPEDHAQGQLRAYQAVAPALIKSRREVIIFNSKALPRLKNIYRSSNSALDEW